MADQKLTDLSAIAAVASEDLLYIVDDPSGTPVSNKVTVGNLFAPDTDFSLTIGRCLIDSRASDSLYLSHVDMTTTSNYAFRQHALGGVWINAASGRQIKMGVNGSETAVVSDTSLGVGGSPSYLFHVDATGNATALTVTDATGYVGIHGAGTSKLHLFHDALAATQDETKGIRVTNSTAANITNNQISPPIVWEGGGYNSTNTDDERVEFMAYVTPTAGDPVTGSWGLWSSIDGAAYAERFSVDEAGNGVLGGGLTVSGVIGTNSYTVAGLPAAGTAGAVAYASDGRKAGEGVGSGTGVLVFDDGTNWIAVDTGATVAA